MDRWVSQSRPPTQYATAVGLLVVGGLLALGFRGSLRSGGDAVAGFWLGVLLVVIGAAALLATGRQTVVVDPGSRTITVTDSSLLRSSERVIRFDDVTDVGIGYLGKRSNFVNFYYLTLHLVVGRDYALFAPGRFFPGASDRSTVEAWRRRLLAALGRRD